MRLFLRTLFIVYLIRVNLGMSIRALWEQMEELIDLMDQVKSQTIQRVHCS